MYLPFFHDRSLVLGTLVAPVADLELPLMKDMGAACVLVSDALIK